MKNKELKEALEKFDDDNDVVIVMQNESINHTQAQHVHAVGLVPTRSGKKVLALMANKALQVPGHVRMPAPLSPGVPVAQVAEVPPIPAHAAVVQPPIVLRHRQSQGGGVSE